MVSGGPLPHPEYARITPRTKQSTRLLLLSLFGALLCPATATAPTSSVSPPPPSRDPWYTSPTDFEAAALGAVLRVREAQGGLAAAVANASAAYHVLYRTTDTRH